MTSAALPDPSGLTSADLCPTWSPEDGRGPSPYCQELLGEVSRAQAEMMDCELRHAADSTYCLGCGRQRVDVINAHVAFRRRFVVACAGANATGGAPEEAETSVACEQQFDSHDGVDAVKMREQEYEEGFKTSPWHLGRCDRACTE